MSTDDGGGSCPTVSVVIAAFNVYGIIHRAVEAALHQTLEDIELIIVDDGSTDSTHPVAQALAGNDPRLRVLRLEANGGPGIARATGLAAARGRWIAVLDADDSMAPERLGRLVRLAEDRQLDLIADNLVLIDPEAGPIGLAFPLARDAIVPLSPERVMANSIPGGRVNLGWMKPLIRRDFLQRNAITWQPLRHAEDLNFLMQTLLAGARAELVGAPGYLYTQRYGSRSKSPSPHSRTQRDAEEQIRAVDLLEQISGPLPSGLARRLARMRPEIRVATNVICALEHLRQGRYLAASSNMATAAASPLALARCIAARFGPASRRVL